MAAIVTLATWLRYLVVVEILDPEALLFSDMRTYLTAAQRLLRGGIDGLVPTGYPLLVALSIKLHALGWAPGRLDAIRAIQVAAGSASLICMWLATRKWLGADLALIVLAFGATHLPFVVYPALLMPETLFGLTIAILTLLLLSGPFPWNVLRGLGVGLVWGLGWMLKGQASLFLPLALLWSLTLPLRRPRVERAGLTKSIALAWVAFALGALVPVTAQTALYTSRLQRFVVSPSISGLSFAMGKCLDCELFRAPDGTWMRSPNLTTQNDTPRECRFERPFADSGYYWGVGLNCIRERPSVLVRSVTGLSYMFFGTGMFPFQEPSLFEPFDFWTPSSRYQWITLVFVLPGLLAAGASVWLGPVSPPSVRLVQWLALTCFASAAVFLVEMRHRVPFDTVLIPVALSGWMTLFARVPALRAAKPPAWPLAVAWALVGSGLLGAWLLNLVRRAQGGLHPLLIVPPAAAVLVLAWPYLRRRAPRSDGP